MFLVKHGSDGPSTAHGVKSILVSNGYVSCLAIKYFELGDGLSQQTGTESVHSLDLTSISHHITIGSPLYFHYFGLSLTVINQLARHFFLKSLVCFLTSSPRQL